MSKKKLSKLLALYLPYILIIMYQYGFDNISTFFATNFVSDYLHKIPCLIVFKSSYNKHITLSGVHQSLCSIRRLEQQRKALCGLQFY